MNQLEIKQELNVFIINGDDPQSPRASGTKSYVMDLSFSLAKQGINTTLIGIGTKKSDNLYPFKFISILKDSKTSSFKFLFSLFIKSWFLKIPESSIIHAQRPDNMLPFVLFFRKNPKVCTLHGLSQKKIFIKKGKLIAKIYEIIEVFTLKRTDSIISVDDSTKNFYIKKYRWLEKKLVVIPVGIDLTRFKPLNKTEIRKKFGFTNKEKIIMYAGRLESEKNLEFLIDIFCEFNNLDCKLVLVGNGKQKTRLQRICDRKGLKNVIFMGELSKDQIPEILNCADVFVLTSLFESGPLVVIEAIACNVPVVSTDVGRVREFINQKDFGIICKMNKFEFINSINNILKIKTVENFNAQLLIKYDFRDTVLKTKEIYYDLKNKN